MIFFHGIKDKLHFVTDEKGKSLIPTLILYDAKIKRFGNQIIKNESYYDSIFSERVLGPLKLIWAKTIYPENSSLCETDVLARLESDNGCHVNILASVGGVQPDRQELTVKGSKRSRRISEFYKDSESLGTEFLPLREEPIDPRAESLKGQLDDLSLNIRGLPNRLATIEEAFRVQGLVENILSKS